MIWPRDLVSKRIFPRWGIVKSENQALPFAFHPHLYTPGGSNRLRRLVIFLSGSRRTPALRRTAEGVRFSASAIVSTRLALKMSAWSSLSCSAVQGGRGVPVISPSPSAHLQLFQPDLSQDYLQLSGT
jgi:hypothetical protein